MQAYGIIRMQNVSPRSEHGAGQSVPFLRVTVVACSQAPEDLVMSTANDFRERSEEYQLIQSAIPAHDKYSSDG